MNQLEAVRIFEAMKQATQWCSRLGHDRKVIGDFACHLHCLIGLGA